MYKQLTATLQSSSSHENRQLALPLHLSAWEMHVASSQSYSSSAQAVQQTDITQNTVTPSGLHAFLTRMQTSIHLLCSTLRS